MKIIILGAGRVGQSVADSLVSERNDITVIDTDAARLRDLESRFDLRGVVGNGIEPAVLAEAGAQDSDLLIACAAQDETNLVCAKVAQMEFNVPQCIARVRTSGFEDGSALLSREGFAVDHILCPEDSLVRYIAKLVEYPGALQVREFAGGRACLVSARARAGARRRVPGRAAAVAGRQAAAFRAGRWRALGRVLPGRAAGGRRCAVAAGVRGLAGNRRLLNAPGRSPAAPAPRSSRIPRRSWRPDASTRSPAPPPRCRPR